MIVLRGGLVVGQIASAVARGKQLAPDPGLPLEEQNLVLRPGCRGNGGHHARSAAANDPDPHSTPPLVFLLLYTMTGGNARKNYCSN